jgi:DNA helicase-2/ATP-dependent DNA helicase PcrA
LYLLACRELLDEPVDTAGNLYVGPHGPDLQTRSFSDTERNDVQSDVRDELDAIEAATFVDYTAGGHCEFCPHRSLPCSDGALE